MIVMKELSFESEAGFKALFEYATIAEYR